MHKFKTIIIATILSTFAIFSASAQVSLGINVKGVSLDAKGSETTSSETRQETLEAIVGSIFAEYKIMDLFSVGVEMIPYDIESETVTNNRDGETVDTGTSTVQVDLESNVGVYVMVPLGDQGVYVKGGYTHSDIVTNENMNTSTTYGNDDLWGTHVSLGFERDVMEATVRLEGTFSEYENVKIGGADNEGGQGNIVTVSGMDGYSVGISLLKSF